MSKIKVLITGANGFIGRSLTNVFKNNILIDLFAVGKEELDLYDEKATDKYILQYTPDIIIHTASIGGGRNSMQTEDIVQKNLRMFFNIAKHASNVKKIIHLGSGAEYGKHRPIVFANEDDANDEFPKDDYGFYKAICSRYIQKTDNIINLRIFGCYGELEDYRFKFISNAVVKNLLHLPITINQNVFFDYIYIGDLVKMIEYFVFNPHNFPIYNAASGHRVDLVSIARTINKISANQVTINLLHHGLNNEYTADNSRIMKEIQGLTLTKHDVAIKKIYDYFKNNINVLDTKLIKEDPYVKYCDLMWKTNEQ